MHDAIRVGIASGNRRADVCEDIDGVALRELDQRDLPLRITLAGWTSED